MWCVEGIVKFFKKFKKEKPQKRKISIRKARILKKSRKKKNGLTTRV